MALLAFHREQLLTSEYLAGSVNSNPVTIRRIIAILKKAGVVVSQQGSEGGAKLALAPEDIHLWQIYQLVHGTEFFTFHPQQPNQGCFVGRNIQGTLQQTFTVVETALAEVLSTISLAQICEKMLFYSTQNEK